ncbi:MAG: glycosyltransferase family 4 protein [Chloroflexi bacterium]|nr:glycosyltransferase family 4 protein [Chloroflexota bacterium]
MVTLRIAFVVQRYGDEITGGAERLCQQVAQRLAQRAAVDVLTTTALDYRTWATHYPPGSSTLHGVSVRRFPVAGERAADFERFSARLFAGSHALADERRWLDKQGPLAPDLLAYLRDAGRGYDAVVFFTYLYSPTVDGLPLVAERAILAPTAHDEPPLGLRIYDPLFAAARHLLYLTEPERRLVERRFAVQHIPATVVGAAVDAAPGDGAGFRARRGLDGDVLLYAGRVEPGKGCADLLAFHRAARARHQRLHLVLVGHVAMPIPDDPFVHALGFVSEEEKRDALAAATVVVAPARHESLCLAALEAWACGKPVLANAQCEVLVHHCLASNAGLFYGDSAEFAAGLDLLLARPDLRAALGRNGQRYVARHYAWPAVEGRWWQALEAVSRQHSALSDQQWLGAGAVPSDGTGRALPATDH